MEQSERKPRSGLWVVGVIAGVAVAAMVAGAILTARILAEAPVAEPLPEIPVAQKREQPEVPAARQGKKAPREFGLPNYPASFAFRSMEVDRETGSSAFHVRKGSSQSVSRYYIEELGASGWNFLWEQKAQMSPGEAGKAKLLKGTRVRWMDPQGKKQLTLLVLDDPRKDRTAQAVLSWAPLPKPGAGRTEEK